MDKKVQSFADAMMGRLERQIQLLENEAKTITEQAAAKVTEITDSLKIKIAEIEDGHPGHEHHLNKTSGNDNKIQGRTDATPPAGEDRPRIYPRNQLQAQGERSDKVQASTNRH
jgi:hypothetical protein